NAYFERKLLGPEIKLCLSQSDSLKRAEAAADRLYGFESALWGKSSEEFALAAAYRADVKKRLFKAFQDPRYAKQASESFDALCNVCDVLRKRYEEVPGVVFLDTACNNDDNTLPFYEWIDLFNRSRWDGRQQHATKVEELLERLPEDSADGLLLKQSLSMNRASESKTRD
ncbi:MAG: hypothetical protein AAF664_24835, partial [Planctomycetota bacterium]